MPSGRSLVRINRNTPRPNDDLVCQAVRSCTTFKSAYSELEHPPVRRDARDPGSAGARVVISVAPIRLDTIVAILGCGDGFPSGKPMALREHP